MKELEIESTLGEQQVNIEVIKSEIIEKSNKKYAKVCQFIPMKIKNYKLEQFSPRCHTHFLTFAYLGLSYDRDINILYSLLGGKINKIELVQIIYCDKYI